MINPVAAKLEQDLASISEVKIDELIRSRDDMKWIISLLIVLVHVLHRCWRRWNEMRKANV